MKTESQKLTCKLTSKELQNRKATVIAEIKQLVLEKKEFPDGFTFKFESSDASLDKLIEFTKTERICCDFFNFQVNIEGSSAWLKIYGNEGVKDFIQNEIGL
jgi:hypothetical protein